MKALNLTTHPQEDLVVLLNNEWKRRFSKDIYPIRYGWDHEVKLRDYLCRLNLQGEIKQIRGRDFGSGLVGLTKTKGPSL